MSKLLESGAVLDVPASVAVCPYCGGALRTGFSGWTQLGDGSWIAECLDMDCVTEPELAEDEDQSDQWEEWLAQHTYMPYVYWLPVDLKVTKWVNANYRFKID